MKTFAIINRKGGVGKTMSTYNLATAMAVKGKKVLMVDIDPQGSLSRYTKILEKYGEDFANYNISKLFTSDKNRPATGECIYNVELDDKYDEKFPQIKENLFIIPSNSTLENSKNGVIVSARAREGLLKRILKEVKDDYDYCFIDCPPSSDILPINAIVAADKIIFVSGADDDSIEGINQIYSEINNLYDADLIEDRNMVQGVIVNLFNSRVKYEKRKLNEISESIDVLGIAGVCSKVKSLMNDEGIPIVLCNENIPSVKRVVDMFYDLTDRI